MFVLLMSEGMNPFYQNITAFPTVFFTFFLLLSLLYWLVAMLGFVEIDALDFDIPDADGSLDVNTQNGMSNPDALAGLALKLRLHGVPVTIIVSLIALIGWVISYYLAHFFSPILSGWFTRLIVGTPILLVSLYFSVMLTAQAIRPLRPLFNRSQQEVKVHVLGQIATVRTSRVDKSFGEVNFDDGGAGLILKARSSGDVIFYQGDRVVLVEQIESTGAYRVVSEEEFFGH